MMNGLVYLAPTQVPSGPRGMDSPYMLRRLGLKAYEHKFTKGFQHRKDEMHVQVRPPRAPPQPTSLASAWNGHGCWFLPFAPSS